MELGEKPIKKRRLSRKEKHLEKLSDIFEGRKTHGFSCGLNLFDRKLYGWWPGYMYVIGGRRGMGKTTWNVSIIDGFLRKHKNIRIFFASLDMAKERIIDALAELSTGISLYSVRDGSVQSNHKQRFLDAVESIYESENLKIVDLVDCKSYQSLMEKFDEFSMKKKFDVFILDHFQKAAKAFENQLEGSRNLANDLHALILDHDLVGIINSQVNKGGAQGKEKYSIMYCAPELETNADYIFLPNRELGKGDDENKIRISLHKNNLWPANIEIIKGRDKCDGQTFHFAFDENAKRIVNLVI